MSGKGCAVGRAATSDVEDRLLAVFSARAGKSKLIVTFDCVTGGKRLNAYRWCSTFQPNLLSLPLTRENGFTFFKNLR